jgi:hypothetical protein
MQGLPNEQPRPRRLFGVLCRCCCIQSRSTDRRGAARSAVPFLFSLFCAIFLPACDDGRIFGEIHSKLNVNENASLFYHDPIDENPQRVVRLNSSQGGYINIAAGVVLDPTHPAEVNKLDVGVDNLLGFMETGTLRAFLTGADAAKFKLYLFNYNEGPHDPTIDAAGPAGYVDVNTVMPGTNRFNCFRVAPASSAFYTPGVTEETWTAVVNVHSITSDLTFSFLITLKIKNVDQDFIVSWYGDSGLAWAGPTPAGSGIYNIHSYHPAMGTPANRYYLVWNMATSQWEEAQPYAPGELYGISGDNFTFLGDPWSWVQNLTVFTRLEYDLPGGGTEYFSGYCVIKPDKTQESNP